VWNNGETLADENQPFADFFLYFDDEKVADAAADFVDYSLGFPNGGPPLSVVGRSGAISRLLDVSPGEHKIELRWATCGVGPHTYVECFPTSASNHATIIASEVSQ